MLLPRTQVHRGGSEHVVVEQRSDAAIRQRPGKQDTGSLRCICGGPLVDSWSARRSGQAETGRPTTPHTTGFGASVASGRVRCVANGPSNSRAPTRPRVVGVRSACPYRRTGCRHRANKERPRSALPKVEARAAPGPNMCCPDYRSELTFEPEPRRVRITKRCGDARDCPIKFALNAASHAKLHCIYLFFFGFARDDDSPRAVWRFCPWRAT